MNLTSLKTIRGLLKQHRIFPSRRLGQNFLINKLILLKIIKAAGLQPNDVILEIGSGIGNLTQEIAKRVKKVVAVEKDLKMIEVLKEALKDYSNVEIIQGDILKISNTPYPISSTQYKIVANLPYYIVSPVIRKFLEISNQPKLMILMVQKEVAQRICTKPSDMNLLAVAVQFYAKPEIISFVPKKSFWPKPKVDGAILRIAPLINADRKLINTDLFFKIVRAGFSQPRKQLLNNLSKKLKLDKERIKSWLLKNGIDPSQRAETLSLKNWLSLTKSFDF